MSRNHVLFPDTAQCEAAKQLYDKAFEKWFSQTFLPGHGSITEMCCKEEFKIYHDCTQQFVIKNGLEFKLKRYEDLQKRREQDVHVESKMQD